MSANVLSLDSLSPGRDLDAYVQTVNALPVLSAEEEKALAERFYYENDVEAARQLVLCHQRKSLHQLLRYLTQGRFRRRALLLHRLEFQRESLVRQLLPNANS